MVEDDFADTQRIEQALGLRSKGRGFFTSHSNQGQRRSP